jgi:hypothetical protein
MLTTFLGCQRQCDKNGDFDVAKQILGKTNDQSVRTYAQRSTSALKEVNQQEWENAPPVVATGRKLEIVRRGPLNFAINLFGGEGELHLLCRYSL